MVTDMRPDAAKEVRPTAERHFVLCNFRSAGAVPGRGCADVGLLAAHRWSGEPFVLANVCTSNERRAACVNIGTAEPGALQGESLWRCRTRDEQASRLSPDRP